MRTLTTICLMLFLPGLIAPSISLAPAVSAKTIDPQSPEEIQDYIKNQSAALGLNPEAVLSLVNCESSFVPQQSKVPNPNGPNGQEDSWGVWQIYLPGKNITRDQAMSVVWSTKWAIDQILAGSVRQWTCARDLGLTSKKIWGVDKEL